MLLQLDFSESPRFQRATLLQLNDGRLFWWFAESPSFLLRG